VNIPALPPVLTIAALTIREASRRKLLLALAVLTLIVIGFSWWGYSRIWTITDSRGTPITAIQVRSIAYFLTIVIAFMFSAVMALSSVLIASPSVSGDVESGLALSVLARPLRRSDMLLGKWLGLTVLVGAYATATILLETWVIDNATGYSPPHMWHLIAYLAGQGIVLLTLSLLLSTRISGMTGGVIALVLYFMAWIGGIVGGVGAAFNNTTIESIGIISRIVLPTDGLWRGAVYSLEPAAVISALRSLPPGASANPFATPYPPADAFLIWVPCWVVIVLALAIWSFRTREI
jgi:ABC-type transport system involved in multi-copper enzyme maturation permease subunit